jgi:hypothetical protein
MGRNPAFKAVFIANLALCLQPCTDCIRDAGRFGMGSLDTQPDDEGSP